MVIHSKNVSILCQIPPSLKGVASDWFYFFPSRSIYNFRDLTKLFLAQYSSLQEFKQNNHHLFSVKMSPTDGLKAYIGYFQNQLAKVYSRSEDASALAFINRLRGRPPVVQESVKYNVTHWSGSCTESSHTSSWRKQ